MSKIYKKSILAVASMFSGIGIQQPPWKFTANEVLEYFNEKNKNKPKPIPNGVKIFKFGNIQIYAINRKNAERKYRNLTNKF